MCAGAHRDQRQQIRSPGVTGYRSWEPSDMGAGNQTCVPWKSRVYLTAKPPLYPPAASVLKQEKLSLSLSVLSRKVGGWERTVELVPHTGHFSKPQFFLLSSISKASPQLGACCLSN